ncbi:general stress protein [Herbaspirillum sp. RV1423]|uniref:general stress protein n=1 Tax=Herbaspirillum sp. RV1423 TaxID=1443993 RepID=UPI0004BC07A7|nr:general stress protein [Herbaspirillum sp. RV1423]
MTQIPSTSNLAVATYAQHQQAEDAVKALQLAGFDMKKISIIGKDYRLEEHVVGYLNAGDRAKIFGKLGAFWGGLLGILFGSAMLSIPVVGQVIVIGPLAALIFGGLEGAVLVGGASALVGAMTAIGIPKNSVLRYENAIKAGEFLLVVHGTADDVLHAKSLLRTSGPLSFDQHNTQDANIVIASQAV